MSRYHFVNVGFGDCTILEYKNPINTESKVIMIDCGWGYSKQSETNVAKYLKNEVGIPWIDVLIITHPHYDHFYGMKDILDEKLLVLEIWGSPYQRRFGDSSLNLDEYNEYLALQESFKALGTKSYTVSSWYSQAITASAQLTILGPIKTINEDAGREVHDGNIVVRIAEGKDTLIVCGDASDKNLQTIMAEKFNLAGCNILRASHHGSINGADLNFIKATKQDKKTIISTKAGVKQGVPDSTALKRYGDYSANVLRTDIKGHIVFA